MEGISNVKHLHVGLELAFANAFVVLNVLNALRHGDHA